uniref:Glutaredoxin domain-containing protein n=1 Tax=Plectus sambesii TaxID=2011161 RepID=A0A914W0C6_9BILA
MFSYKEVASAKEFVDELLKNKKVVVFAKSDCPYSSKSMEILNRFEMPADMLVRVDLDKCNDVDFEAAKEYLESLTGARTVPRVFINGKFIGGGDDVADAEKSGELEKMLKKAEAI